MEIAIINNPDKSIWKQLVERPSLDYSNLEKTIKSIFNDVSNVGDEALRKFTLAFDKVNLESFELNSNFINNAENLIDIELKNAILIAKNNIEKFHDSQKLKINKIETSQGVVCWQEHRAIETVGLYIPGGTAPLFSTVLMLGIPAKLAGCKEIILCTPPFKDGTIHPAIVYAAKISGITKIYTIGGAQAIAAMSLGTKTIPKVQKIFGPGNQYVTSAKQLALTYGTAIDMPAGPSELLVICSDNTIPAYAAADLLSQAEHGIDSQVVCLSTSESMLKKIIEEITVQLNKLPRKEIAKAALIHSKFIYFAEKSKMIEFSNTYAPEHLIIADRNFEPYISQINNAGSVFLGNFCPESAGDYASGTNHTLPTAGYAKTYSGVNLDSFIKKITFQEISKSGLNILGPTIEKLAEAEGLFAHKNAVSLRLRDIN